MKVVIVEKILLYLKEQQSELFGGVRAGHPVVGNNVTICMNASVVGGITIGNDVVIAANSFVDFDVPDGSIVVGNPGVIHKRKSLFNEFSY